MKQKWTLVLWAVFIISTSFFVAVGQSTGPDGSCPHPQKFDRSKAAKDDTGEAWTNETSTRDGLVSLTACWVFENGLISVKRLAAKNLLELPSGFEPHIKYGERVGEKIKIMELPLGHRLFKDMAFEIRTKAYTTSTYITVKVPAVTTEDEFKRLSILFLDEGSWLPGRLFWQPYTLQLTVPQNDFKTRTLRGGFDLTTVFRHGTGVGRFVVVSFDQAEFDKSPPIDLIIQSVVAPSSVKAGAAFSYVVTIKNSVDAKVAATDSQFTSMFGGGEYVSSVSTQGACRQSIHNGTVLVCELGTIAPLKTVTVTVTVKAEDYREFDSDRQKSFSTHNFLGGQERDSNLENNRYEGPVTMLLR